MKLKSFFLALLFAILIILTVTLICSLASKTAWSHKYAGNAYICQIDGTGEKVQLEFKRDYILYKSSGMTDKLKATSTEDIYKEVVPHLNTYVLFNIKYFTAEHKSIDNNKLIMTIHYTNCMKVDDLD